MPLAPIHTIILSAPCYQGNIRQVTDADGKVEQDNHYSPYGMLMAESSDILAGGGSSTANPYLFGAKEYLTTTGANLLDFTARTYDPSTLLFQTQDPMAGDYTSSLPYLYCGSDPVNWIDPDGKEKRCFSTDKKIMAYAEKYNDKDKDIIIFSHGNYSLISYNLMPGKSIISNIIDFRNALVSEFNVDLISIDNEPMMIELHACRTGYIDDTHKAPIAQQLSKKFNNAIIMAPNGYLETNLTTGKEKVYENYVVIGLDADGEPMLKGINPVTPEWRYFYKGQEIQASDVDIAKYAIIFELLIKSEIKSGINDKINLTE